MRDSFERLLRWTLISNATFSSLSGLICIVASSHLAGHLGIAGSELVSLGIQLLLFAGVLAFLARRPDLSRPWILILVALFGLADLLWVVGSAGALNGGLELTPLGRSLVAGVAVLIGIFGILELVGATALVRRARAVAAILGGLAILMSSGAG